MDRICKLHVSSFFIALILLCSLYLSNCDQEVEDEREFTYDVNSERGPKHWGEIREEWRMCNNGGLQSPIDLINERVDIVSNLGRLSRDYHSSNSTLRNRGHDMVLRWVGGAGHININGKRFQLQQAHWHSPSEHTLNGQRFDMEVHLVHESADGQNAVVAILYKTGRPDTFLKSIENNLGSLAESLDVEINLGVTNPRDIKIGSRKYYRYIGSLTVPPCSQDVIWTIVRKIRTVTRKQVQLIRDAVHDDSERNARPVQAINERRVELFRPEDQPGN
jgi:carbonic anhydrase